MYSKKDYREELKFDNTVKQTCKRCNNYSLILTRAFYEVNRHKIIPESSQWLCSSCHRARGVGIGKL